MQKKLMVVAVAGALSAPALALAQASTVQIYGKAVIDYSYIDQSRTKPNSDTLSSEGGMIGFKGTEALGGGLSAWFQCESTADTRGDSQSGFCGRNSALGLKGGFGNVYIGRWDTPFKKVANRGYVGVEQTGPWGASAVLQNGSASTGARAALSRT